MNILVTGCAGFIGFSFSKYLLEKNNKKKVYGIDNINDYYSVNLKKKRKNILLKKKNFYFKKLDLSNANILKKFLKDKKISIIYHFAAQPGVRYFENNPDRYFDSNLSAFFNLLNTAKLFGIKKIVYASSSSVYGEINNKPITENSKLNPKNFYALSKKINEELADHYSKKYNIQFIGLRFFSIFGEWGRPDMLILKTLIYAKKKMTLLLNNFGNHHRDFTYIGDVVRLIYKLKFKKNESHAIYNICSSRPISLSRIVKIIGKFYQLPKINKTRRNNDDVLRTFGSNKKIIRITKFKKITNLDKAIENTISWFKKNNF